MKISKAQFITSASKMSELPEMDFPEVCVIWRSNVGKSSLINMLVWNNNLAKTSMKPGKTQLINYFLLNENFYFVDLPGYGYAKVWRDKRITWMDTTYEYFVTRENLKKVFVLIDGKLPPQKLDIEFISELVKEQISFDIIVTKIDKTTQKNLNINIKLFKQELKNKKIKEPTIFLSSSVKHKGKDSILDYIDTLIS